MILQSYLYILYTPHWISFQACLRLRLQADLLLTWNSTFTTLVFNVFCAVGDVYTELCNKRYLLGTKSFLSSPLYCCHSTNTTFLSSSFSCLLHRHYLSVFFLFLFTSPTLSFCLLPFPVYFTDTTFLSSSFSCLLRRHYLSVFFLFLFTSPTLPFFLLFVLLIVHRHYLSIFFLVLLLLLFSPPLASPSLPPPHLPQGSCLIFSHKS
jgi:hypothetical protein